ncbi:DNA-directed RNA polymerase I subunit RPA43 [Yarrowia sp. C11]|nr:DNA-directed RNA polymerase I subunit RPA43 [Yarrowia sp. C11]KAG5364815.1 DNA-directed RNA polymerase I subunit RPA43 [Yarrowia sp. E02]
MAVQTLSETQEVLKSMALKRKNPIDSATGISECFHKVSTSMYVSLAPMFSQKPVAGIKSQHLDPLVARYFAPAGGVVLAHYNLKLYKRGSESEGSSVMGKFVNESPFTFMWISTDLLVWKPQVGDRLEGYVNMQTPSHIGLLVHDTFNCSIKYANIPEDWVFTPFESTGTQPKTSKKDRVRQSMGYWSDGSGKRVEGKLEFIIKSVHTANMVYLSGSLVDTYPAEAGGAAEEPQRKKTKFTDEDPIEKIAEEEEEKVDEVEEEMEKEAAKIGYDSDSAASDDSDD